MDKIKFNSKEFNGLFLTLNYRKNDTRFHLMLNVQDCTDLLWKSGIIDGWDRKNDFDDTVVMVSVEVFSKKRVICLSLEDVIVNLTEPDCMRMIRYHESLKEFEKKGFDQMAIDTLNQLREIEALKEGRKK
jgi:hypothetical protein